MQAREPAVVLLEDSSIRPRPLLALRQGFMCNVMQCDERAHINADHRKVVLSMMRYAVSR